MSESSDTNTGRPGDGSASGAPMDAAAVRKVATLCHLDIPDDRCAEIGHQLSGILEHVDQLRSMDLTGVEPMAHVGQREAPLADDAPSTRSTGVLDPSVLETLAQGDESRLHREPGAPDADGAPGPDALYIRVPKVIGGES